MEEFLLRGVTTMKSIPFGLAFAAVLGLGLGTAPASAVAQSFDRDGWWSPVVQSNESGRTGSVIADVVLGRPSQGRDDRGRPAEGSNAGGKAKDNGQGPPFCRNGQGHPVHGQRWCQDKGWSNTATTWQRAPWGDVVLGRSTPRGNQRVSEPTLGGVLGDVVLGRVSRLGRDAGLRGPVEGRWLSLPSGGSVLQLRMAGVPIAEMADTNRDGRADVVLLNRLR